MSTKHLALAVVGLIALLLLAVLTIGGLVQPALEPMRTVHAKQGGQAAMKGAESPESTADLTVATRGREAGETLPTHESVATAEQSTDADKLPSPSTTLVDVVTPVGPTTQVITNPSESAAAAAAKGESEQKQYSFTELYERFAPMVVSVQLWEELKDGRSTLRVRSSGVIIDPQGLILTNYNSLASGYTKRGVSRHNYQVIIRTQLPEAVYTAHLRNFDRDADLAILKIDKLIVAAKDAPGLAREQTTSHSTAPLAPGQSTEDEATATVEVPVNSLPAGSNTAPTNTAETAGESSGGTTVSKAPGESSGQAPEHSVEKTFSALQLNGASQLKLGEEVLVIGFPDRDAAEGALSRGILTVRGKTSMTEGGYMRTLFQTDAFIPSGSSGAPVFNRRGEFLGLANCGLNRSLSDRSGYFYGGNALMSAIDKLKESQLRTFAYLGIMINPEPEADQELALLEGFANEGGLLISAICENSPAYTAGLKKGDIILDLDGQRITGVELYTELMRLRHPGDLVRLRFYRPSSGEEKALEVVLARYPY